MSDENCKTDGQIVMINSKGIIDGLVDVMKIKGESIVYVAISDDDVHYRVCIPDSKHYKENITDLIKAIELCLDVLKKELEELG